MMRRLRPRSNILQISWLRTDFLKRFRGETETKGSGGLAAEKFQRVLRRREEVRQGSTKSVLFLSACILCICSDWMQVPKAPGVPKAPHGFIGEATIIMRVECALRGTRLPFSVLAPLINGSTHLDFTMTTEEKDSTLTGTRRKRLLHIARDFAKIASPVLCCCLPSGRPSGEQKCASRPGFRRSHKVV